MSETPNGSDQGPGSAAWIHNPRKVRTVRNIVLLSAIVVLAIAGFAVVVGKLIDRPSSHASYGPVGLPAIPGGPSFAPLNNAGAVPANVLDALQVPAGSTVVSRKNQTSEAEAPFDGTVTFASSYSPAQIEKFFPAELTQERWRIEASGDPVIAQIAGTDSNLWVVGVTVSAGPHSNGSRFKIELYTYEPGD